MNPVLPMTLLLFHGALGAGAGAPAGPATTQATPAAAPSADSTAEDADAGGKTGADGAAVTGVASAAPEPVATQASRPPRVVEAVPHYRADLGVDIGADTYLFQRGQTAFELEISPRLSFLLGKKMDAGIYLGAGYGGAIPEWSQMTMFGVGPFLGLTLPVYGDVTFNPWLGVMYHYAFLEGFTGPDLDHVGTPFPQQSIRIDAHSDFSFWVGPHTALNAGVYVKSRLAPISEGPGTAAQISYGLRLSATSSF